MDLSSIPKKIIVHKSFPSVYLKDFLKAYHCYEQDISDISINLIGKDLKQYYMMSRFGFNTLFKNKKNRTYKLICSINNEEKGLVLDRLNSDERVGWFGHELGHIKDYHEKNGLQLIWFGIKYGTAFLTNLLIPKWKKPLNYLHEIENRTHQAAIDKGLGKDLAESIIFQNTCETKIPKKTLKRLKEIYDEDYVIEHTKK